VVTTNTRKKVCWSLCGKSIFITLMGGVLCIITYLRPLLYFKCFGTHYHHGDKGLFVTPHGLVYWPMRGGLSPWAQKKREVKERTRQKGLQSNSGPMCAFVSFAGIAEKQCMQTGYYQRKSSYSGGLLTARTAVKTFHLLREISCTRG